MSLVFIEKLIKKLIMEQDYILLPSEVGKIEIKQDMNVLIKQDSQYVTYIQVINADSLSLEAIHERLEQKDATLLRMEQQTKVLAYNIFTFSEGMDEQKLKLIQESQYRHETEPKCLKNFVVDADNRQVRKLFHRPNKDRGLYRFINQMLVEDTLESYENTPVETLVYNKKKEYEMTYEVKKPVLTYGLIAINILVYLALVAYEKVSGISYGQLIIQFGAKVNSLILEGDYWRLLTPMFLHGGLTHLLVNCYSLYMLGSLVERLYGRGRFLASYLIAGILGNLCSFLFVPNVSVGASGAIFGLMGVLLYFGLEKPLQFKVYFGRSILTSILINLVYGFTSTGIDNFAHLGGLVGGFLAIGIVANTKKTRWYFNRLLYVFLLMLVTLGGLIYGFNNNESQVSRSMNTLEKLEEMEKWDEVEKVAKEVLEKNPRHKEYQISALWSLIRAEALQGKYDEAMEYCKELITLSPANGHYMLGILYYDQGQMSLAKEELLAAKAAGADEERIQEILNAIE